MFVSPTHTTHQIHPLPVKKLVAKWVEFAKWLIGIHNQCVARDDSLHVSIHDGSEAVCGGFRPHSAPHVVLLKQISAATQRQSRQSVMLFEVVHHADFFDHTELNTLLQTQGVIYKLLIILKKKLIVKKKIKMAYHDALRILLRTLRWYCRPSEEDECVSEYGCFFMYYYNVSVYFLYV